MIDNLREFEIGLSHDVEKAVKAASDVGRKIGLEALRGVVLRTPVDTGRARGNWQVSINDAITGQIDRMDGQAAISEGSTTIAGAPDFGVIYITNNLPYIIKLEEGSSKQAPAGMVEVTLNDIEAQFK